MHPFKKGIITLFDEILYMKNNDNYKKNSNWYTIAKANNTIIKESGLIDKLPSWLTWALVAILSISGIENAIEKQNKYNEVKNKLSQEQKQILEQTLRDQELMKQLQANYLNSQNQPSETKTQQAPPTVSQPNKTPTQLPRPEEKAEKAEDAARDRSLSKEEKRIVDIISRTIWGEAKGESWEGQKAVASTLWNRAKGNPKKLDDVAKQNWQYSVWNEGNVPERGSGEGWKKVVDLAEKMVTNQFSPTVNFTHYFNPKIVKPYWAYDNGKLTNDHKVIGRHIFVNPENP